MHHLNLDIMYWSDIKQQLAINTALYYISDQATAIYAIASAYYAFGIVQ